MLTHFWLAPFFSKCWSCLYSSLLLSPIGNKPPPAVKRAREPCGFEGCSYSSPYKHVMVVHRTIHTGLYEEQNCFASTTCISTNFPWTLTVCSENGLFVCLYSHFAIFLYKKRVELMMLFSVSLQGRSRSSVQCRNVDFLPANPAISGLTCSFTLVKLPDRTYINVTIYLQITVKLLLKKVISKLNNSSND